MEAAVFKVSKVSLSKLLISFTALGRYRVLWTQARLSSSSCCAGRKLKIVNKIVRAVGSGLPAEPRAGSEVREKGSLTRWMKPSDWSHHCPGRPKL